MPTKFVLKNLSKTRAKNNPALAEYVFDGSMFTLGSDATNNLVLAEIAPEQAVIIREDDHLKLINGAEGTHLNGQKLRREAIQPLAAGDEIRLGNHIISVVDDDEDMPFEKTEPEISANGINARGYSAFETPAEQPADVRSEPKTSRNFAAVLDTLRTEEDSFYFIVKNGEKETKRVPLEQAEMPVGINSKGEFAFIIEEISNLFAVVRKDWSGILLESQRRGAVFVNGEAIETTRRLRNDDRVNFPNANGDFSLVLHEPSLLVALEPMLSERILSGETRLTDSAPAAATSKQTVPSSERRYFGSFSFVEILTMLIGTLIGAVLFFLFFEFMFS